MNKIHPQTGSPRRFAWRRLCLVGLTVCLLLLPLTVSAQSFDFDNTVNEIFKFFSLILTALQAVLWPVLILMGGLLGNDLLFSGGMNTMLLNIWTHIRDFVNIIFVLIMLFVAIYNISGLAGENYSISKVLPKIAIALIAVNFSFLMAKVVLDAVNIATTAIFAVPLARNALSIDNNPARLDSLSKEFCEKIINLDKETGAEKDAKEKNAFCEPKQAAAQTQPADPNAPESTMGKAQYQLTEYGKQFFSSFNSRNVALIMAIELMEITKIDEIKTTKGDTPVPLSKVESVKDLAINTIFSLIFFVIYATAFVALFITLLVRVVVLWATIALMPLSFLGMAFEKAKIDQKNDPLSVFLTHALVPVKVALALTIGTIMITQVKQSLPGAAYNTDATTLGAIVSNMSTLQEIMAGLATAAVVWMAAFWSMEGTKATPYVEKLKGYVENFGKGLAKLPLYAPILPIRTSKGTTEKVGLAFLGGAQTPMDKVFSQERDRYAKLNENKGEEYKGEIDKTRNKAELDRVMGKISTDRSAYEQTREALAAKLAADNYKLARQYSGAYGAMGYKSPEEFVKALKEDKNFDFEKFKTFTGNADIKPDFDNQALLDRYKAAVKPDYTRAPMQGTEIGKAAKELEKATKELDKVKTEDENKTARVEAEKAFKTLQELERKREFTLEIDLNKISQDKKLPQDMSEKIKNQYEELSPTFGQAEARNILIKKLTEKGVQPADATTLADNIISGVTAPAAQPGGHSRPGTGNPPPPPNSPTPPPARTP